MDEQDNQLTPREGEPPAAIPEEPGPQETEAPAAPRPAFTRDYPVFGYE